MSENDRTETAIAPVKRWRDLALQGRQREMIGEAEDFLKRNPLNSDASMVLGFGFLDKDQLSEAVSHLKRSLVITPKLTDSYSALGNYFQKVQERPQSEAHFRKALTVNPAHLQSVFGLINLFRAKGEYKKSANISYQFVNTVSPNPKIFLTLLEDLLALKDYGNSLIVADRILISDTTEFTALASRVINRLVFGGAPENLVDLMIDKATAIYCGGEDQSEDLDDDWPRFLKELSLDKPVASGEAEFRANPNWITKQKTSANILRNSRNFNTINKYTLGPWAGFSHSSKDQSLVELQYKALTDAFPNGLNNRDIAESEVAPQESTFTIDGRRVSETFLVYLGVFFRIETSIQEPIKSVLEIGPGYGGLTRIFRSEFDLKLHVLVDLPESLAFSYSFLKAHSRNDEISVISEQNVEDFRTGKSGGILMVPVDRLHLLEGFQFDICINTRSFQEMTKEWLETYTDLIQSSNEVKYLYSFNYFLNPRSEFHETGQRGSKDPLLWVPDPDEKWSVKQFNLNPLHLCAGTTARNWLELLLKRNSESDENRETVSLSGSESDNVMGKFYQEFLWFKNKDAAENLLSEIRKFLLEEYSVPNYRRANIRVHSDGSVEGLSKFSEYTYLKRIAG